MQSEAYDCSLCVFFIRLAIKQLNDVAGQLVALLRAWVLGHRPLLQCLLRLRYGVCLLVTLNDLKLTAESFLLVVLIDGSVSVSIQTLHNEGTFYEPHRRTLFGLVISEEPSTRTLRAQLMPCSEITWMSKTLCGDIPFATIQELRSIWNKGRDDRSVGRCGFSTDESAASAATSSSSNAKESGPTVGNTDNKESTSSSSANKGVPSAGKQQTTRTRKKGPMRRKSPGRSKRHLRSHKPSSRASRARRPRLIVSSQDVFLPRMSIFYWSSRHGVALQRVP